MLDRADLGPRLLAAVGYTVFALLAIDQLGRGPIQALDPSLLGVLPHTGPLAQISSLATHIGDQATLIAVALLGAGILIGRGEYLEAGIVALAKAVCVVVVFGLKALFARPRPLLAPDGLESHAFPSGHAAGAAMVFMLLAVLLFDHRRKIRPWAEGVAIGLALVVGSTRLFLGAHWPTDVVAGWGLGWGLAGTFLLFRLYLKRREALAHVAPGNEVPNRVGLGVPERVDVHNEASVPVDVEDMPEERPVPCLPDPLHAKEGGGLVQRFVAGEHGP